MSQLNLQMLRGNDFSFTAAITLAGAATNIAGGAFRFMAKFDLNDADGSAAINLTLGSGITITNAAGGTLQVTIPRSATNVSNFPIYHAIDLPYALQMNLGGATETVLFGTLTVLPSVSQTSP